MSKGKQVEIDRVNRQMQEEIDRVNRQMQEEIDRINRQAQEEIDRVNRQAQEEIDRIKKAKQEEIERIRNSEEDEKLKQEHQKEIDKIHSLLGIPQQKYKIKCQKPKSSKKDNCCPTTFEGNPTADRYIKCGNYGNIQGKRNTLSQVEDTTNWPYCAIGVVCAGKSFASGCLIAPKFVLTCAHLVVDDETKMILPSSEVFFHLAQNGTTIHGGRSKIKDIFVPDAYFNSLDWADDYAVLALEDDMSDFGGCFGIFSGEIKSAQVNLCGYPSDRMKQNGKHLEMWEMRGKIYNFDEQKGILTYQIDSSASLSGSPLLVKVDDEYFVAGIHFGRNEICNFGNFINQEKVNQIENFINKLNTKRVNMKNVHLCNGNISVYGLKYLVEENYDLSEIECLYLQNNNFGPEGAKWISQMNLPKLSSWLYLDNNNFGPEGAKWISQMNLPNLSSHLYLNNNNITDEGRKYFDNSSFKRFISF